MRVLQVLPTIARGGAEQMVLGLTHGLRRRNIDTVLLSLGPVTASGREMLRGYGVDESNVVFLDKVPGFDPAALGRLRQWIRSIRPDVIHTHQHALRYVLAAAVGARWTPCLHTLHTPEGAQNGLVANLMHMAARRRGVLAVAVAPTVAGGYLSRGRYERIAVVPNGVDVGRFVPDGDARCGWRGSMGVPSEAVTFVCVARFDRVKNQELLVHAFAGILGECPAAMLVLVGDGPLLKPLQAEVCSRGWSTRIRFLGLRADVEWSLQGSDVFVLSSNWEGNPLSILEAMAVGLPVVAPRVGGIPDVVEHGRTGLLFAVGDQAGLGEILQMMYRSPDLRAQFGRLARSVAESKYSVERMVAGYLALYEGMT